MGGKMSRDKGQRAERSVAAVLNEILERVCVEHGISPVWSMRRNVKQTQGGGFDLDGGCDDSCLALNWMAIEVKHHAELKGKVPGWWRQAVEQAENYAGKASGVKREPVLIYRGNGTKWFVRVFTLLTIDGPQTNVAMSEEGRRVLAQYSGGMLVPARRRLKVAADISFEDFLRWFEQRVISEAALTKERNDLRVKAQAEIVDREKRKEKSAAMVEQACSKPWLVR